MKIEDALLLLAASKKPILAVKDAVEIIELVTHSPEAVKEVLARAEEIGLIKREGSTVYISEGASGFRKPRIRKVDCDSTCRRCGVRIKNCFYIELEDRVLGPYGSECVQRIL